MNSIEILGTGSYLPEQKVYNQELEKKLKLEDGYIEKRTGIKQRYYTKDETIVDMAVRATENIMNKLSNKKAKDEIGLVIVATTSSSELMPGISNEIQKKLDLKNCIAFDILAGCSGFINAIDIAKLYIETGKIEKAIVVGDDKLSEYRDEKDIGTSIILSDGAGAILIGKTSKEKNYFSVIQTEGKNNEILTCKSNEKIKMNGKEVYKYAVTRTVENLKKLLKDANEDLDNIDYIIPHQSNMKIMKAIASRLEIDMDKMYTNIETKGNTFCATIPIALDQMKEKELLKENSKIILLGYGGGLNTGSIMLEI